MRKELSNTENFKKPISNRDESAKRFLERILPDYKEAFILRISDQPEREYFKISGNGNKIELESTNVIGLASALNWYLKYTCNCHFSWSGDQLSLPQSLPIPTEEIIHHANFNYRYYLNYCTFSYSTPWWNWERWQREIDWMALNGINLPLSIVGQEAVWQNLLRKLEISEDNIFSFLPGPAFAAWGWLGNFDGWGGPTTQGWIDSQKELQLKILKRLRELEITPVLQAFTGRVPACLKEIFPEAKIDQLPGWYGYEGVYFLDPNDPLFKTLSKLFVDEQTKLYGNDHFFAGDVFHEIESPSNSSDYLQRVYKGIQEGLLYADKSAQWVLQSWSIREDNIDILDENHTIILDLYCDSEPKWKKTNAFHGHPWIWSIINNFGGRVGMGGKLKLIAEELPNAINSENSGKLVGIGMAPEGIGNNPIIYDFITEMNWNSKIGCIEKWVEKFSYRRYGCISNNIKEAWLKLLGTVYSGPQNYPPTESVICALPSLNISSASSNGSTDIYYDVEHLALALELLLEEKEDLKNTDTYIYDIIDVCRQLSLSFAYRLYKKIKEGYESKNLEELRKHSDLFNNLIEDLDELLSSNSRFCVSSWLNDAKKLAKNKEELKLLEWNARRQITLWSSPEITEFHDYANKQWGGLLKDYYLYRWKEYFNLMVDSILKDKPINENDFKKSMSDWAVFWSNKSDEMPQRNDLDSIKLVENIFIKYKSLLNYSDTIRTKNLEIKEIAKL